MHDDTFYMKRAIDLAWAGIGRNTPNPLVGCVIVKDDGIVGEGAHILANVDHAEIVALKQAGSKSKGATVYVTLEPCPHQGNTPPCTDALIKAGVKRVIYGLKDPNPAVNGNGDARLREAGIDVQGGLLADEIREQNKFFVTAHEKNRPFVLLKWAMTADGKIATRTGESRWISSDASRNIVHHLRNIYDGILVGHSTVMNDNPRLTCRVDLREGIPDLLFPRVPSNIRHPRRIVLDTFGVTTLMELDIFDQPGKTIMAVGPECEWDDTGERDCIDSLKVDVLECPLVKGYLDLEFLLAELKKKDIYSVMIEGGAGVSGSFLEAGLVDEVVFAVAPKIFGGESAPGPVGGSGIESIKDAWIMKDIKHFSVGDDLWMLGKMSSRT